MLIYLLLANDVLWRHFSTSAVSAAARGTDVWWCMTAPEAWAAPPTSLQRSPWWPPSDPTSTIGVVRRSGVFLLSAHEGLGVREGWGCIAWAEYRGKKDGGDRGWNVVKLIRWSQFHFRKWMKVSVQGHSNLVIHVIFYCKTMFFQSWKNKSMMPKKTNTVQSSRLILIWIICCLLLPSTSSNTVTTQHGVCSDIEAWTKR